MDLPHDFGPVFRLSLVAEESDRLPLFADTAFFLNDVNLLYEFSWLIVDPDYKNYHFSRLSEDRPHLLRDDKLIVESLAQESPIAFTVVIPALPAVAGAI